MINNKVENSTFETYFKILESFITEESVSRVILAQKFKISEDAIIISNLLDSGLIKIHGIFPNLLQLTPAGMSTYLSLKLQKKSDRQARIATNFATASIVLAIIMIAIMLLK